MCDDHVQASDGVFVYVLCREGDRVRILKVGTGLHGSVCGAVAATFEAPVDAHAPAVPWWMACIAGTLLVAGPAVS